MQRSYAFLLLSSSALALVTLCLSAQGQDQATPAAGSSAFDADYSLHAIFDPPVAIPGAGALTCTCDDTQDDACDGKLVIEVNQSSQLVVTDGALTYFGLRTSSVGGSVRYTSLGWIINSAYPTDVVLDSAILGGSNGTMQLVDSTSGAPLAVFNCKR